LNGQFKRELNCLLPACLLLKVNFFAFLILIWKRKKKRIVSKLLYFDFSCSTKNPVQMTIKTSNCEKNCRFSFDCQKPFCWFHFLSLVTKKQKKNIWLFLFSSAVRKQSLKRSTLIKAIFFCQAFLVSLCCMKWNE
jgi:hypothetical protein